MAVSFALQEAVYGRLSADPVLAALVGTAIFDAPPSGTPPLLYVLLGAEVVKDRSSKTSAGAQHDFVVKVVSDAPGFSAAKQVAAAVNEALVDASLVLSRGHLISLQFVKAQAQRGKAPEGRKISLTFRALVQDI
jgi:hypothetical protein